MFEGKQISRTITQHQVNGMSVCRDHLALFSVEMTGLGGALTAVAMSSEYRPNLQRRGSYHAVH